MASRKPAVRGKRSRSAEPATLIDDIRSLIAGARAHVAATANATLTLLYWRIGCRIQFVSLSRQLSIEHGPSFGEKNLGRMIQFAKVFPDEQILVSLIRELSWTHLPARFPWAERDLPGEGP